MALRRAVAPLALVAALLPLTHGWARRPPRPGRVPVELPQPMDLVDCPDRPWEPGCESTRSLFVDYDTLGVESVRGGRWLSYDLEEVTSPVRRGDLSGESDLSVAVRLLLSEIGPERLVESAYGLNEAIGILYTVTNRLDPLVANPLAVEGAPFFPGCGPGGDFRTCAEPQQYLGLLTRRGLDPQGSFSADVLGIACDLAVLAWWLHGEGLVPDPTGGATNYVHRCGGAAYGWTTPHCDAHLGRPWGDVRGADPHTGPIVFLAPSVFDQDRGVYRLRVSRWIDYRTEDEGPDWDLLEELDVDPPLGWLVAR